MNNIFIHYTAVLILGVSWVIAWQQVLYSAHLPGDSFTAAVFLLIAIMLQFVVLGRERASEKLPARFFLRFLLAGLALFIILAVWPLFGGKPMLYFAKLTLGGKSLSSTIFFELAIFLTIVGVVTFALVTFKEPD